VPFQHQWPPADGVCWWHPVSWSFLQLPQNAGLVCEISWQYHVVSPSAVTLTEKERESGDPDPSCLIPSGTALKCVLQSVAWMVTEGLSLAAPRTHCSQTHLQQPSCLPTSLSHLLAVFAGVTSQICLRAGFKNTQIKAGSKSRKMLIVFLQNLHKIPKCLFLFF
jgi:hypothetical protein